MSVKVTSYLEYLSFIDICENTFKCDDELVGAWHLVGDQYMVASLM